MDREKEWSLIIEDANTRLHLLFKNAVILKQNKFYIKSEANRLFSKVESDLKRKQAPIDLISKTVATMQRRFVDWYNSIIRILEKEANSNPMIRETIKLITQDYKKVINKPLKESNAMIFNITDYDLGSIDLNDSVTTQEYAAGQAYMDDYVKTVKKAMKSIAGMNLVMKDKNGRKLSVRNLAEMTARFENTKDRLKELKDKGIEFVVASSHANSSARCQIWQGKIFKLDVDPNAKFVQKVDLTYKPVREGVIDGLDYYSLRDAMVHGFLGYNCRHRLVKYTKGMSMFNEYPANRIEKERNREIKQRELERKIRNAKKEAYMAATPEDRKKWTEKSKMYQEEYHNYCKSKGLVEIPWRTQISRDERSLNIDFDGNGLTYGEYIHNFPNNSNNFNNKILLNDKNSDTIQMSGGVFGALDSESQEAEEHANRYYGLVRKMKTDAFKISQNTGIELDKVKAVKQHVFLNEYNLNGTTKRFDPNYDMAQAWQRLIEGKNIKESDYILLEHEFLEYTLMQKGMDYVEAHLEANKKFNWFRKMREEKNNVKD